MNALTFPLRNLGIHRMRSVLTSAGIGAALAGLLTLLGFSRGVDRGVVLSLEDRHTDIAAMKRGSIELLSAQLDEGLAARIRAVPGVVDAVGTLGELVEMDTGEMSYISGWPAGTDFWRTLVVTAGNQPEPSDMGSVVLGQALARALDKKPGDQIELSGVSFQIAAISKQRSVIDDRSVMMPLTALQHLLGREGKVNGFHIRIDHPEDPSRLADVRTRLSSSISELEFVESSEMAQHAHITSLLRAMAWASSTVALVMAFVVVLNTLLMAVTERSRELGLLSAIGWKPSRVIAMIVTEGLLLAAAGAAIGVGAGLIGLRMMIRHPQIGTFLQPEVTLALVLQSVALVLLVGALGGLYPAWRATRIRPMELLRGE